MKGWKLKKIFLILILAIIFISGCAKEKLTFSVEDLNDKQLTEGIYYEYKYSDEEKKGSKEINSELILNNLIKKNTPLAEAWFKSYAASCCPPNTNRCMQAIVEPVFLIKLIEETRLESFVKANEPEIGFCAYVVKHYIIQ